MSFMEALRQIRAYAQDRRLSLQANDGKLAWRLIEVFTRTWDLGFTAFGGPPVHFQILHSRFVKAEHGTYRWIDEQTYQELFAICQSLPGPASTKMVFYIALIHAGILPAIFAFALWSLPGAVGMYALALGVQKMPERLPPIVYALLSGLNASTVGIIALAAMKLAEKAVQDDFTRILMILSACAGICYSALWYFPVLMFTAAFVTILWDAWFREKVVRLRAQLRKMARARRRKDDAKNDGECGTQVEERTIETTPSTHGRARAVARTSHVSAERECPGQGNTRQHSMDNGRAADEVFSTQDMHTHAVPVTLAISVVAAFLASFIVIMVMRGALSSPSLAFSLLGNMILAGTVIFGGGPIVIPLLRSYVVDPGWVSSRDFLIGLAMIQAFPGPNCNFGVFLGALTFAAASAPTILGSFIAFFGLFAPGLTLAFGMQSLWRILRSRKCVISALRGINAAAVGLIYTAVYRLWQIGYLTPMSSDGQSLAKEPWWVVIASVTYAESAWFGVSPPLAIVVGSVLGIGWYGAVGKSSSQMEVMNLIE